MIIAGFQKLTLLDYPDKVAALIFTQGCNFACGYCHNPEMIPPCRVNKDAAPELEEEYIMTFLKKRQGLLDGVVITGGEPTLHDDLEKFIRKIKKIGFLVKLDSNGSNPGVLENLIEQDLIDYIAMDIKFPLEKYPQLARSVPPEHLLKSISLIMNSGVDYEFRSTILPAYHSSEDLVEMGKMIEGSKRWFLQNFRPGKTLDPELRKTRSFGPDDLKQYQQIAQEYAEVVGVRN